MAQFVREFLSVNPEGRTRDELREIVRTQPAFRQRFERNPQAFNGLIGRLLMGGEIEERAGNLLAVEATRLSVLVRKDLFEVVR